MNTEDTDVATPEPVTDGSQLQPSTSPALLNSHSSIMNLLNTTLTLDLLQNNHSKLESLKKSSIYIMILVKTIHQPVKQDYISDSALWRYINLSRFERMKRDSTNHVILQLELLRMLHDELTAGRKELENILAQGCGSIMLGDAKIKQKILRLHQVAKDFDECIVPGKLVVKHRLIPELINKNLPKFKLFLLAQKRVMFNQTACRALRSSVVLHWYQEADKVENKFEVRFKLISPENQTEARNFGYRTCQGFICRISRLMPNRLYKFSVKRANFVSLIYGDWKDEIILTTDT